MKKLNLGDLFTRDEFRENVENGGFIDTDGEGHERELSGGEANTTNNRMELSAVIHPPV